MKHFGKMIVGACTVLTLTCTPAQLLAQSTKCRFKRQSDVKGPKASLLVLSIEQVTFFKLSLLIAFKVLVAR